MLLVGLTKEGYEEQETRIWAPSYSPEPQSQAPGDDSPSLPGLPLVPMPLPESTGEGVGDVRDDPDPQSDHVADPAPALGPAAVQGFIATRYGESYENQPLGCGIVHLRDSEGLLRGAQLQDGLYHSVDPTILAVGYTDAARWPCGTELRVCAPQQEANKGRLLPWSENDLSELWCLIVVRVDTCPGCGSGHLDLSESGLWHLCGWQCDRLDGLTVEEIR